MNNTVIAHTPCPHCSAKIAELTIKLQNQYINRIAVYVCGVDGKTVDGELLAHIAKPLGFTNDFVKKYKGEHVRKLVKDLAGKYRTVVESLYFAAYDIDELQIPT